MSRANKKVFVALSGGVDSSVAAALLKEQGYEIIGCHIRCFNIDGCGERDAEDARRVAEKLKIPFYVFDLEEEYKEKVVSYMVSGYKNGITPNPDVMCNSEIKFGLFLKRALELGADYIATGHYVTLKRHPDRSGAEPKDFCLVIAKDKNKDQSYFLWTLTQDQLKHCLFPIGDYPKSEVRKLAKKFGLLTADKKDSQGICFLGKISLADFLKEYIPEKKGLILNTAGQRIGEHNGAQFYTIGQRHGLNLGRITDKPHYIAVKDVKTNTITVAEGNTNPALYKKEINLTNINFINKNRGQQSVLKEILVRIRYRQPLQKAILFLKNRLSGKLTFTKPQKFIASGQSAVFYEKTGKMLGGGVII